MFGPAVRAWRAAVVLGLALAGCASATPDTDSILALFGEAAYRAGRPVVTKFAMTDLTITVAGERGPQYDAVRPRLEVRLSRRSDLTGLVFIAPKEGDDPDFSFFWRMRSTSILPRDSCALSPIRSRTMPSSVWW